MDIKTELALAQRDPLTWSYYVRSKAGDDPYLSRLADMLNPKGDDEWQLKFRPRGKGNPKHGLKKELNWALIASRFWEEMKKRVGRSSFNQRAEDIVAKENGITPRTVRDAVKWATDAEK